VFLLHIDDEVVDSDEGSSWSRVEQVYVINFFSIIHVTDCSPCNTLKPTEAVIIVLVSVPHLSFLPGIYPFKDGVVFLL